MNHTIKLCLLFFFAGIFFTACNKENIDTTTPTEDPTFDPNEITTNNLAYALKASSEDAVALGCMLVTFPFDLVLEEERTLTILTYNEYKTAIESPAPNRVTDFKFPLNGIDTNGDETQFEDARSLGNLFASCVPDEGWIASTRSNATIPAFLLDDYCFDLVYPVNLEDEEGNGYVAENENELIDYCITIDPLFFSLPLTVLDLEGTAIVFDDVTSFFDALVACEGISPPAVGNGFEIIGFGCNTLQYPFDVLLEDGSIATITNEDEYANLLLSGVSMEIQYPFALTNLDGETIVINVFEDLIPAFEACGVTITIEPIDCVADIDPSTILFYNISGRYPYEINLPITLIRDDNGEEAVINDYSDYFDNFGNPFDGIVTADIVYPISIKQFGQDRIIASDEDMCELYESLFFVCDSKPAHIQLFYSLAMAPIDCAIQPLLPLEVIFNSTSIELTTYDQYYELLEEPGSYDGIEIVYPVSVQAINGGTLSFGSDDELCDFLNNCN
ncbi:MAG: hypothetical protein P1U56_20305 [Saprospiraceae bacterium]|nr:hypothetical protein [Saprospiraceae bacterium]